MKLGRVGVSYVVTVAIMTAITIALGLFLWGIVGGWVSISALDIVEETNKGVAQQRSLLIIEFVDLNRGIVWVSNPGKVDLVVLLCAIYPRSSETFNSLPRIYREVTKIYASMDNVYPLKIGRDCELDGSGPYIVEIHAIASTIYNAKNPLENAQWAIVVRQNV